MSSYERYYKAEDEKQKRQYQEAKPVKRYCLVRFRWIKLSYGKCTISECEDRGKDNCHEKMRDE